MPKIIVKKEGWLKLGYKLFAEKGMAGLVVEKMASQLKCNKSSFYWHFKTKKAFLAALIDHWIQKDTQEIIALANTSDAPANKFEKLLQLALQQDPYLDFIFHLKRHAIKDKQIQAVIDEVDQKRVAYLAQLLQELGYSPAEAQLKAQVTYKYIIGYHEMIRYKKQPKNFMDAALTEIQQFVQWR